MEIKIETSHQIIPKRKFFVLEKINEICTPTFGKIYHIDLLYITPYLFRICKIDDLLTRGDKRNKYTLLAHLDKHKKEILIKLEDDSIKTRLLDSILKERCVCRGQSPFSGTTLEEFNKLKTENERIRAKKAQKKREYRERQKQNKEEENVSKE